MKGSTTINRNLKLDDQVYLEKSEYKLQHGIFFFKITAVNFNKKIPDKKTKVMTFQ
jgi:hypothetical protein